VVQGTGFFTGRRIRVCFQPAPPNSGIRFLRTDARNASMLRATPEAVTGTNRRTTLGQPPHQVELVEHVLAALHGLRIDNCLIELDGPELPGLDGSASGFSDVLLEADIETQEAACEMWQAREPISVAAGTATLTLYPHPRAELQVSYLLDYGPASPIIPQRHTHRITPESFCNGLSAARTFLLKEEAEALTKQGVGANTSLQDLLVFGPHGPLENTLRAANEPARHKVLDIVGDLALVGCDVHGHLVGCRSGHALNVALARKLREAMAALRPNIHRRAA
jgi:UDP-3-O-acyl N-acetylglucosamine deacetylase